MKIGILTFHRAHNYGAVLQCFALQEILTKLGFDVEVVDYRQPWIEGFYGLFNIKTFNRQYPGLLRKIRYVKNLFWRKRIVLAKRAIFDTFRNIYLHESSPCSSKTIPDYDIYIIGSDQVWSSDCLGGKFDNVFLGDFNRKQSSRLIGYAISSNLESICELNKSSKIEKIVQRFYLISFREQQISDYVSTITGKKIQTTLDPTLLTTSSVWTPLINNRWQEEKYVIIYQIRTKKETTEKLYNYAKAYIGNNIDIKIIDLSNMSYSVSDFVSLIKYAQRVFTTSFHATVFSLIFEKPLNAFCLGDGLDERYVNLLEDVGCMECVSDINVAPIYTEVDYSFVRMKMNKLRENSINYIKQIKEI